MQKAVTTVVFVSLMSSLTALAQHPGHGAQAADTGKAFPSAARHWATGVVKAVNPKAGAVTLAHGPVKSLNWPAMTMEFKVRDAKLFDKLAIDRKVEFEFIQENRDYIVTGVK